jgi:hypothetical protein
VGLNGKGGRVGEANAAIAAVEQRDEVGTTSLAGHRRSRRRREFDCMPGIVVENWV